MLLQEVKERISTKRSAPVFLPVLAALTFRAAFAQEAPIEDQTPAEPATADVPASAADSTLPAVATAPTPLPQPPGGRVLGVLPNYRTADISQAGTVLTPHQKFTIAFKDSFDYPLIGLSAVIAGIGKLSDSHVSFGQGIKRIRSQVHYYLCG